MVRFRSRRRAWRTTASCVAFALIPSISFSAQPIVVQGLACRGDDSTWRVEATGTSAHYAATAPRKRDLVFRGSLQTLAGPPSALVWRGDTTHLPRETIVLAAREEPCRMALPGIPAGTHQVLLSIRPGEAATGCCVVRAGYDPRSAPVANLAAKAEGDWARQLARLVPALNACVARSGAAFKAVTAAQAEGTSVRVRLRDADGKEMECTVDASGRGAATMAPLGTGTPAGGPWWYPARDPAPIVACGRLERVQNARGALIGYLQYDPC